jgi:anthranilate synthase component 1
MFFMQDNDFTLFGASPESSLKYDATSRQIEIYPIAGTRPRGRRADGSLDRDLDSRIELEMRTDHKELSEHLMLVDLARNDLARICTPGSRYVADLTKVDRYSFVMHLVSRVVGELRSDLDVLHAYRACMNMGVKRSAKSSRYAAYRRGRRSSPWQLRRRGRLLHGSWRSGYLYCHSFRPRGRRYCHRTSRCRDCSGFCTAV